MPMLSQLSYNPRIEVTDGFEPSLCRFAGDRLTRLGYVTFEHTERDLNPRSPD